MRKDLERSKRRRWDSRHCLSNIKINSRNWKKWWYESNLNYQNSLSKNKNKSQGRFTRSKSSFRRKGKTTKFSGQTTKSWRIWRISFDNSQLGSFSKRRQQGDSKSNDYGFNLSANTRTKWVQCKLRRVAASNWRGFCKNALTNTINSMNPWIRLNLNPSFIVTEPKNSRL